MKHLITTCLVVFVAGMCRAQSPADTAITLSAEKTIVGSFNHAIGKQSWLYNGAGYTLERRTVQIGNPFYLDSLKMNPGSVVYYGYAYHDVPLLYDINRDLLVSLFTDNYSRYYFTNQELSSFNIDSHHFIRVVADSTTNKTMKTGFYDELYKTQTLQVLVRRTKYISEVILNGKKGEYVKRDYYYIRKDGKYYQISGQGDLLDLFPSRKKEIKKELKEAQLSFNRQPEEAMVLVATNNDRLTN